MNGSGSEWRTIVTIIKINAALLYAVFLVGLAWLIWPDKPQNWPLGAFAIVCCLAAFALAVRQVGEIWRFIARDITVDGFHQGRRKPQSDSVAGEYEMRQSGMLD